jgi:hypothetical protein
MSAWQGSDPSQDDGTRRRPKTATFARPEATHPAQIDAHYAEFRIYAIIFINC